MSLHYLMNFNRSFGRVNIIGGGYNATLDMAPNPPNHFWTTYCASLTADVWGTSTPAWAAILSDVQQIRIIMESTVGVEVMGFDNFKIETVPIPGALLLVTSSLIGLSGFRKKFRAR